MDTSILTSYNMCTAHCVHYVPHVWSHSAISTSSLSGMSGHLAPCGVSCGEEWWQGAADRARQPPGLCPFAIRGLTGSWNGYLTTAAAIASWPAWHRSVEQSNVAISHVCVPSPAPSPPLILPPPLFLPSPLPSAQGVLYPTACWSGLPAVPSTVQYQMERIHITSTQGREMECDARTGHW